MWKTFLPFTGAVSHESVPERPGQSVNPSIRFHFPDNNFIFVNSKRLRCINNSKWLGWISQMNSKRILNCMQPQPFRIDSCYTCLWTTYFEIKWWNWSGNDEDVLEIDFINIFRHCDFLSNNGYILEKCAGGYIIPYISLNCQQIPYFEAWHWIQRNLALNPKQGIVLLWSLWWRYSAIFLDICHTALERHRVVVEICRIDFWNYFDDSFQTRNQKYTTFDFDCVDGLKMRRYILEFWLGYWKRADKITNSLTAKYSCHNFLGNSYQHSYSK